MVLTKLRFTEGINKATKTFKVFEMATVTDSIAELESLFRAKIQMENQIAELKSKLVALETEPKKSKKVKEPKEPKKSKYATPEELAEARKQNGLRLAAANRARREAKKLSDSESGSENGSA